jgi:ABC-type uncharacterized transport system substrate-binding protein
MMFANRLRQLSWTEGEDLQIDYRYGLGDVVLVIAKELVDSRPDVILAITAVSAMALRQYTLSVPAVFVQVGDPVAWASSPILHALRERSLASRPSISILAANGSKS